jgi:hypothetical protein
MQKVLLMKTNLKLLVAAAAVALSLNVSAVPTPITSDYLLGRVVPGTPSSEADELVHLNFLITKYNAGLTGNQGDNPADAGPEVYHVEPGSQVPAPNIPAATTAVANVGASGDTTIDLTPFVYHYLGLKYGNDRHYYYIFDLSGEISLPGTGGNGKGLSHYVLFDPQDTPMPDGGTTLLLLGAGLLATGAARRLLKR